MNPAPARFPSAPTDVSTITDPDAVFIARIETVISDALHLFDRCADGSARLRATHRVADMFRNELRRATS